MKNWIDITMPIQEGMKVYKNKEEKKPQFIVRANHETSNHYESSITMDMHTGTHIDMPLHMIAGGENSDQYDVSKINGEALVIDLSQNDHPEITAADLKAYDIRENDIVILKTHNSFEKDFNFEFDFLEETGAQYLIDKHIKSVGIDAIGIERSQDGHPTHKILLGKGKTIIEGMALAHVEAGRYDLLCLPLKIMGVEGLPVRAYLIPKS